MKLAGLIFSAYSGLFLLGAAIHGINSDYLDGVVCFIIAIFADYCSDIVEKTE